MDDVSAMRLVYLWIESYKNVQRRELYFTLDYRVVHDNQDRQIQVVKTDFGNLRDNRSNPLALLDQFSAIVGENGTGKSNIFELISYVNIQGCFPENISEDTDKNFVILEGESNGEKNLYLLTLSSVYQKKNDSGLKLSFIRHINEAQMSINNSTILYHPLNDLAAGSSTASIKNLKKITSNPFQKLIAGTSDGALARRFVENILSLETLGVFEKIASNPYGQLVILYREVKKKYFEFEMLHEPFTRMRKKTWTYELYQEFERFIESDEPGLLQYKVVHLVLSIWHALQGSAEKDESHLHALILTSVVLGAESPFTKYSAEIDKRLERYSYGSYIENFRLHLQTVNYQLEEFKLFNNLVNGCYLSASVKNPLSFTLFDFFCSDERIKLGTGHHSFIGTGIPLKIDGLSSGEISAVHFINELKSALVEIKAKGSDCLILLDEPENSFHPEWQRKLISILVALFSQVGIRPQVLISSHSPFVLSDMLSGKALMLGGGSPLENCFAANIHELLSDSFFLKYTIGEASRIRIKEVVDFINEPKAQSQLGNTIEERCFSAEIVINQVSDQLLRSELRKRLNKVLAKHSNEDELFAHLAIASRDNPELTNQLRQLSAHYRRETNDV
ncbi:AAA family ATPase [Aliamphritea hakodatensis]|uniref:AAA family ATPase n=1 Tax=Aliamphritea hakodatensis TaxID=2895352 RepID=UPI0022FDAC12|nr:AAA family ATPase [Aliamphritea hakodatensis]